MISFWSKWSSLTNKGNLSLLFIGVFVMQVLMGLHSKAQEVLPWVLDIYSNPYVGENVDQQFLLTSFLVPSTSYFLGITSESVFLLFNFLIFDIWYRCSLYLQANVYGE